MQDAMSSRESDRSHEQARRRNPGWFLVPIFVLLALANALLGRIDPRWSEAGMFFLAAFAAYASTAFNWTNANASLFVAYRRPSNLIALLVVYAGALLAGLWPLGQPGLAPGKPNFQLMAVFVVSATLPIEAASWWLARTEGDRPSVRRALAQWLPALLVAEMACGVVLWALEHRHPGLLRPLHFAVALGAGPLYLLSLVHRHHTTLKWQSRVEQADQRADTSDMARQLAEARLAVLQAQIEPHFLFNTLATVQYLLKSDPAAADFLLNQLTRYLRLAMPAMRQFSSTLGREFELTDAYLQIARLRMGGRLDVNVDLPQALSDVEFPPLVVQTLVENAIKHGVEPKTGPVRIRVFARQVGSELHVGVQDNGVGLGGAATQGSGTGLQNIRERLQGIHGQRARLSVSPMTDGGVLASVAVPLEKP
ncbi:signal transduction histidine kinase [Pelomonas aquatica]|uniref:Signal transduction histidine kinase n=1 Tax=Pelomonas aquatica TaxID=431058 RepID=A0ABU1Z5J1_9BURK|nr:histidine kinase [Pelomonas aquatica]MDR7295880.1 signal transduction histidine kinase [Pelomonas aquatica]